MMKTQIPISDHLHHEAKRPALENGLSFAEVARRSLEETVRLARALLHHGVTEFATANVKDFTKLIPAR